MGLVFNYRYQLYTSVRLKMCLWFYLVIPKERNNNYKRCPWKVFKWPRVMKDFEVRLKISVYSIWNNDGEVEYKWIFLPNYKNLKLGVLFRVWNRQLEYSYRNASFHDWKFTKFHIRAQDRTKISSGKEADLRWLNRFVDLVGLVYWKQANRCLYAFQQSIHWAPKSRLDSRWRFWIPPAHPTPLWGSPTPTQPISVPIYFRV